MNWTETDVREQANEIFKDQHAHQPDGDTHMWWVVCSDNLFSKAENNVSFLLHIQYGVKVWVV